MKKYTAIKVAVLIPYVELKRQTVDNIGKGDPARPDEVILAL